MFKILNLSVHSKFELDFKSLFFTFGKRWTEISLPFVFIRSHLLIGFLHEHFRNGFQHLTHVIFLNANCSYLSVILYDQMKGCVVLKVIRLILHFWLRERESWIKLPSTQLPLSEILIFLCSVSTICWRCWLLPGSMQTLLRASSLHLLFFASLLKPGLRGNQYTVPPGNPQITPPL